MKSVASYTITAVPEESATAADMKELPIKDLLVTHKGLVFVFMRRFLLLAQ